MFVVDRLLLIAAILLLVGIASSKFSSRIGLPVLVLFLAVGLLAGEEGLGRIAFDNYALAHGIGTVALAVILFDGGLRTSRRSFRAVLGPALSLATLGVLITAAVTGLAASWLLGIPILHGLLIGSIAASTDAAAVFAVLRGRGVNLRKRLSATLEVESGSNDPMAVFLTVGILEYLTGGLTSAGELLWFLLVQIVAGVGVGVLVGRGAVVAINRIDLDAAGLYPILTAAAGLLAYGAAASLGGSGFLSVYLAGLVIGNRRIVFQRGILLFHDGAAWLAQIVMFVMLGLLAFPSQLLDVAQDGLIVAGILVFVARPLAVALLVPWFAFNAREIAFISWVGLKGAVPIVLATYPLLFGVEGATLLFNVVFFAVLVSAVLQGWTLPLLARWLKLQVEGAPPAPVLLEITSLRDVEGDIVEYNVFEGSLAAGRHIRELRLPDGAVVAMLVRGREIIPPRGSTRVEPGDHVFLVLRPGLRALVDRVFRRGREPAVMPTEIEFPLRGDTTVAELLEFYGIDIEEPPTSSLHDLLAARIGEAQLEVGSRLHLSGVDLVVRSMDEDLVERVGLVIRPDTSSATEPGAAGAEPERSQSTRK
jgi:cell volume regulation protein A